MHKKQKITLLRMSLKRQVVLLLVIAMLFATTNVGLAAPNKQTEHISFVNEGGEYTDVVIHRSLGQSQVKVYVDGVLTQESQADLSTKTINTLIYDLEAHISNKRARNISNIGDFTSITQHMPVSSKTLDIDKPITLNSSIYDEPVDNTGLTPSVYGDGYFLGSEGGLHYAPTVYGYLFRDYDETYEGETHTWSWGANETLAAIVAYITIAASATLAGAVVVILVFAAGNVLAYYQSAKVETITFDYEYKVRVNTDVHFTTGRNITYWKIHNTTTNETNWEQKSFNYGFSSTNFQMVKAGIDNYLLSQ